MSFTPRTVVVSTLLSGLLLSPGVANAHSGGPTIVPVLDQITVDVPDGVTVEIVASQAAPLMAVENPTDEVLEVLSERGEAWLRVSAAGVEVNTGVADTFFTTSPEGGPVSAEVRQGDAPSEWVRVSTAPSWAWFEHRLHPQGLVVPPELATIDTEQEIATWSMAIRYGQEDGRLEGRIVHRPATGTVTASLVGDLPEGIEADALSGSVPAIFLGLEGAQEVIVMGADAEPFLRFTPDGVEANTHSPSFNTDVTARGGAPLTDLDPAAEPDWQPVASVPRHAWLEGRARPVLDLPQNVIVATQRVELGRWEIPITVDGEPTTLTGVTNWLPAGVSPLDPVEDGASVPWIPIAGAVLLAAVVVLEFRRRRAPRT